MALVVSLFSHSHFEMREHPKTQVMCDVKWVHPHVVLWLICNTCRYLRPMTCLLWCWVALVAMPTQEGYHTG